jgi:hypothetical protein
VSKGRRWIEVKKGAKLCIGTGQGIVDTLGSHLLGRLG